MTVHSNLIEQILLGELAQLTSTKTSLQHAELLSHHLQTALLGGGNFLNIKDEIAHMAHDKHKRPAVYKKLLATLSSHEKELDEHYGSLSRGRKKYDFSHYYYRMSLGLLHLCLGDMEKALVYFEKAKDFVDETSAGETDFLRHPAMHYISVVKSIPDDALALKARHIRHKKIPDELSLEQLEDWVGSNALKSHKALSSFTPDKLARYFIDPDKQLESASMAKWELTEPGSTFALQQASYWMLANYQQPLSVNFIKSIHQKVSHDVKNLNGRSGEIKPGEFRTEGVQFGFSHGSSFSIQGEKSIIAIVDELNEIAGKTMYYYVANGSDSPRPYGMKQAYPSTSGRLLSKAPEKGIIDKLITHSIETYQTNIQKAKKTSDFVRATIFACVTFCHELSLTHPFSDCNLKTSQQLLNKLLLENGLPMTILKNPSRIEGLSPEELVEEVLQGMLYFEHLNKYDYFPTTEPCGKELINSLDKWISDSDYIALPREARQLLDEQKSLIFQLLESQALSGNGLKKITAEDLLLLSNAYDLKTLKSITSNNGIVDKIITLPLPTKMKFMEHLYQVQSIFEVLKSPLDAFFDLQAHQQELLLENSYQIRSYITSNKIESLESLFEKFSKPSRTSMYYY
jgi:hypothetical protein